MGRLEKLKRQIILEANKRILNESNAGPLDATPLNINAEDFKPLVDGINNLIKKVAKKYNVQGHLSDDKYNPDYFVKLKQTERNRSDRDGSYANHFHIVTKNDGSQVLFNDSPLDSGAIYPKYGVRTSGDEFGGQGDQDAGTYFFTDEYQKDDNKEFVSRWGPGGNAEKNRIKSALDIVGMGHAGHTIEDLATILMSIFESGSNDVEKSYNNLKTDKRLVNKTMQSIGPKNFYEDILRGLKPIVDTFKTNMEEKIKSGTKQFWKSLTSQATR